MTPHRSLERLCVYRRLLRQLADEAVENVYSHQVAAACGVTSAQVRRDLMATGYNGSPNSGYQVSALLSSISALLDPPDLEDVALVGVGNLGRAILAHFAGRSERLRITAAFDKDPLKAGRVIHGCRCYPIEQAAEVIRRHNIRTAILAVPDREAQDVAQALLLAGIKGLLNFAPARLRAPQDVWVENIDLVISLEKVAFLARSPRLGTEHNP